jgi:hypothetical protein
VHGRLTAVLAAAALAFPAAAAADTQQASLGAVTATISWTPADANGPPRDLRSSISRAGQTLVDEAVNAGGPAPWTGGRQAVTVTDLDGDGEPEVIVDAYTGGAHCCTVSRIYRFASGVYAALDHDWANQVYRLSDLNGDGRPEFISADDAFSYAFGSYAESRWPLLILAYRSGHLRDVTRRFPGRVRRDMAGHRLLFLNKGSRPALAAYAADLHRLRRHREARRVVRKAGVGKRFRRNLNKLLRRGGYLR